MNTSITTGYFGKLPMRGDFIRRNLAPEFIQTWDEWLQSVIDTSRNNLQEQWLNYYLVSPVWRYYFSLAENDVYTGVVLPSVDKVGRYFPFTVAANVKNSPSFTTFITNNMQWYDTLENLALSALQENISFEELNMQVDSVLRLINIDQLYYEPVNEGYRVPLNDGTSLDGALSLITHQSPIALDQNRSYWWSKGSAHVSGNLIACRGLPDDNIFTAMLDGRWELCHIKQLNASSFIPY